MSDSEENHQPGSTIAREKVHGSHISSLVKQRPGIMEPLKVICNSSNGPSENDVSITNGLQDDAQKYQTPPCSPKQKEPRAKMSLSPNKTNSKVVNGPANELNKAGIKRGYARKTMPSEMSANAVKVKSKMKSSRSNDSISTSPASSREGSVESRRSSGDSSSVSVNVQRDREVVGESVIKEQTDSGRDDDEKTANDNKSDSSARSSPAKFPPRARKSFPKANADMISTDPEAKKKSSSNHLTFKITDFASKLGLHGQALDTMDAKTLDSLILKAKKDGQRDNSRASSPAQVSQAKSSTPNAKCASVTDSPASQSTDVDDETDESGRSTVLSPIDPSCRAKKKKKRKSGTYNLPSNKRPVKKKRSSSVESIVTESELDKESDLIAIGEIPEDTGDQSVEQNTEEVEDDEQEFNESDNDAALSDDTASGENKVLQRKRKRLAWKRGITGNRKVISTKVQSAGSMSLYSRKLGSSVAKGKTLTEKLMERRQHGEDTNDSKATEDEGAWVTSSEAEETPQKMHLLLDISGTENDIERPVSRKRKASDDNVQAVDVVDQKEVAALKKLKKDDTPPCKMAANENNYPKCRMNSSPKTVRPLNTFPAVKQQLNSSPKIIRQTAAMSVSSPHSNFPLSKDTASEVRNENGELPPVKFQNTPNGLSYPVVTPPDTPESSLVQVSSQTNKEKVEDIPLCCCKIDGTVFEYMEQCTYCQALDSIDGKVIGCCSKVSNYQLVRPAVKIPFMAVCEVHRKRLQLHQICPGCGQFCSQGKFLQCKSKLGNIVHLYHRQCQVFRDNKYHCPHCGQESAQTEVTLKLNEPRRASMFLKEIKEPDKPSYGPRAKMNASFSPKSAENKIENDDSGTTLKINKSNKILSANGLPFGPSKKELEQTILLLTNEKPKKYRSGPKSLFVAAKNNEMERVLYLLAEGADPCSKCEEHNKQSALHVASTNGNLAIVHLLIQAGAVPNVIDDSLRTPLMNAAEKGFVDIVQFLVVAGAVPDCKAEDGMTCLHLAAQSGKLAVVKYLMSTRRVDVNIRDEGGWSPIIWAAEFRHVEIVKYLLEAGANPNIRDNEENTGLHWASYAGSVDIAELLLNSGCDLEAVNEHGDRPLHIACRQDHYECVVLFLARGANSEARNNENETPLTCCVDQSSAVYMALSVYCQLKEFAAKRLKRPEKLLHRDITMGKEQYGVPVVNDCDDENYPTDFQYVNENIETTPMNVNRTITSLQHCECRDDCSSLYCKCTRSSVRCWYDKEGKLVRDFNQTEPPLIFECNKACSCWANCHNRVVQLGITCRLQVFRTIGRGWGCRTLLDIPQGSFVCEYIGEHISDAEADSREDDSYLFDLDNKDTDTFCIDARKYGNVSRFINHLCEPNLIPVKVFIEHQDLRFPRICFFASKDIKAGEELGFDYGEKFWIIKWKQFTCTCGSPKCKYSKDTIHLTIADYERRQREEEVMDVNVP